MSIAVPIDELFGDLERWGFGYLVSVSDDHRPHVVALIPTPVAGEVLRFDVGDGRAARNAAARPEVTVVFPPAGDDGLSLVVDGLASVAGGVLDLRPGSAVLHRPAPRPGGG